MERVRNYGPYHQVKIPRCPKQQRGIFVQRSIFRELIQTNIIYLSKPQVNKCRSLVMLLNSFKSWIKQEFQKQDPQKNKSKSKYIQNSPTPAPSTNKTLFKILRGMPGRAEPARCPETIQSAFWKSQMIATPFPFWEAGYVCGGNACTLPQLPSQQDLRHWSKMFPQHFKIFLSHSSQTWGTETTLWNQEMKPLGTKQQWKSGVE